MLINDILEELRDGKTADELAKEFSDCLNEAEVRRKKEIEAEAEKEAKLAERRNAALMIVEAINDYRVTCGKDPFININDIKTKDIDLLCKILDNMDFYTYKFL